MKLLHVNNKGYVVAGVWALYTIALSVAAQRGVPVSLESPLHVRSIEELLLSIIAIVLVFATPIIIFFIIYAGFLYVTARGNEQQISQASRALLYAIIGGLLILGAYMLIAVIGDLITSVAGTS